MVAAIDEHQTESVAGEPKLSAWLWRPWYAKLWWVTIPVWWLGMAASTRADFLEPFYRGALAGYLNVLFFPMTALMVLGVGYVRERLDNFVGQGEGRPLSDEEAETERQRVWEEHERMVKRSRAFADPSDPRSGPFWIGNPLNPLNPGYVDPHTGKHR
ncbi:hypothetical protein SAMN05518801_12030 [Novosphingobium sp. CF614]|uniref:hypothetical protein n=1 Tax=Novosphingobium sp. CF614 TaxID=1884364 RepID=UPI0008EBF212|nr:hypothetical protein [Novosphingobium sp. CF614]SFG37153.1 hypothetical protein SAMN05518801_12030 [Novosphingobium sp. CF614]